MSTRRAAYWNGVGERWLEGHPDALWRRCSDAIHETWLDRAAGDVRGQRVLKTDLFDEAFGDGLSSWFERHGNRILACDLAFSTARGAVRKQTRLTAAVADVRRLPFAAGAFDCVFSDSTLDHFDNEDGIRRSIEELCRVLRPGGTLLLTMDNPANPLVWLRNQFPAFWMRLGVVPYSVGVTRGARRLQELLAAEGFDVEDSRVIMHVPRVLAVAICRWLTRHRGVGAPSRRGLAWLRRFEGLGTLPSRTLTGHFVAVVARKRS